MGHELSFQLRLTQTTCLLVCQYAAQIAHHPKIKVEIQMVFIDIEPTFYKYKNKDIHRYLIETYLKGAMRYGNSMIKFIIRTSTFCRAAIVGKFD